MVSRSVRLGVFAVVGGIVGMIAILAIALVLFLVTGIVPMNTGPGPAPTQPFRGWAVLIFVLATAALGAAAGAVVAGRLAAIKVRDRWVSLLVATLLGGLVGAGVGALDGRSAAIPNCAVVGAVILTLLNYVLSVDESVNERKPSPRPSPHPLWDRDRDV